MDLEKLKIDRGSARRRAGRGSRVPALLALAALVALVVLFRKPLLRQVDRFTLPEVRVVRATRTNAAAIAAVSGTSANGYVVAAKRAALSADTPGRVVEIGVVEGSVVKAGEVVARLYSEEYEAALRRARAELEAARSGVARAEADVAVAGRERERLAADVRAAEARVASAEADARLAAKELGRNDALLAGGDVGESAVDLARAEDERARAAVAAAAADLEARRAAALQGEAQEERAVAARGELAAQVAAAEAAVEQADATLEKTFVRAPFDGVVVLKDAEVGEVVSPNSQGGNSRGSVATLVDLASLEVQIDLPETLLPQVAVDAPARVFLDAYPDAPYAGRVLRIWPTANRQKATVEIRVGFDEPDERLRPDLGARVVFGASGEPEPAAEERAPRVFVPSDAIVRVDGAAGVFLLERDVVRWHVVTPGEAGGGRTSVEVGLEGGERLVADPPADLADGERVRVAED